MKLLALAIQNGCKTAADMAKFIKERAA